jgi:hypothetical protein
LSIMAVILPSLSVQGRIIGRLPTPGRPMLQRELKGRPMLIPKSKRGILKAEDAGWWPKTLYPRGHCQCA